jgi:hypothetical protein
MAEIRKPRTYMHPDESATGHRRLGLRMSGTSKLLLISFVLILSATWIFTFAWTAPTGILWHVAHGSSVTINGRQIAVPWDMEVSDSDDGVAIARPSPVKDLFHSPSGMILVSTTGRSFVFDRDHDSSTRVYSHPPDGYLYAGESDFVGSAGKEYCWESRDVQEPYLSVICSFDQSNLSANFVGSIAYREKFYRIAASLAGANVP